MSTSYCRMILSLPDVNVWIALAAEGHVHHVPARDWFTAQADASVAFCRITQMVLLRLLTNSNVMGRAPRTIVQAWETFAQLRGSEVGLRNRARPCRVRLAPTDDPGRRRTEFLDGRLLGCFC
jgi:predicted nucleic acid-binding protein